MRCYTDADFIRKLGEIEGLAYTAMRCVKIAHQDRMPPHEIVGIRRDAEQTLNHYFDSVETVLQQRIDRGLVKINGPEHDKPVKAQPPQ